MDEPALPSISDYWPVAPHRIGPPADHYTEDPQMAEEWAAAALPVPVTAPPSFAPPPRPAAAPRRKGVRVATVLTSLLLVGSGVVLVVLTRPASTPAEGAAGPSAAPSVRTSAPPPNAVSAIVGERTEASFEMVSDVVDLRLRTAELGDDLYRISTPEGGSALPKAEIEDDGVRLRLASTGRKGNTAVDIVLNSQVEWDLRLTGGVRQGVVDLGSGKISAVDLRGGAARLDLTLPEPDGTLPVRMSGGINSFRVRTADGVPVRVRTRRGAGQVVLNGSTDDGVAKGASFLSPNWSESVDRIDLDAVAGVGTLQVGDD